MSDNKVDISKLQAVKELIFGEEIQDYDAKFKEVDGEIEALKQKTDADVTDRDELIAVLTDTVNKRIDKLEADLNKKIERLQDTKTDRAKLGKLLIQIGEKLQA